MQESDLAEDFRERGYTAPVPVFSARECRRILARLRRERARPPLDWGKGRAATSFDHYVLATHDRILDLVATLIGGDVLLWGASLIVQGPGRVHPWHTDIETASPGAETVSVWIGLSNASTRASLKVVPFSHRFGTTVQEVRSEREVDRGSVSDADVASWARERDSRSGVVSMDAADSQAVLFDGRLWHGTHNSNRLRSRCAVLLQYATPQTPIRIPDLAHRDWPFRSYPVPKPPCIVVRGRDTYAMNRLVPGPSATDVATLPALTARVHQLWLPLEQDPEVGWKPHSLFRGTTPVVNAMKCHASVLDPGRQPHPPHRHHDEELLVILDGEATLVVADGPDGDVVEREVQRGDFAYYPAGFAHTIRNAADAPVSYVMFKWTADRGGREDVIGHRLIPHVRPDGPDAFSTKRVLEGQTRHLGKLHAHVTTLQPDAGYDPHVDAYDVGIVVLEGTVETLGKRVVPCGVVFYAAGESHGMRGVGDGPATYLVFEFHGRQPKGYTSKRIARSLGRALRRRLPTRFPRR